MKIPLWMIVVAYLITGVLQAGWYSVGYREHNSKFPTGYQIAMTALVWPLMSTINLSYELSGGETFFEPANKDI